MTSFFSNPVNGILIALFLFMLMVLIVNIAHAEVEEVWLQLIAPHPHLPEAHAEIYYIASFYTIDEHIDFWISDDIAEDCNHDRANGCIQDVGIIVNNPYAYSKNGCTLLEHELLHWLGFEEDEIFCERSQEFRK